MNNNNIPKTKNQEELLPVEWKAISQSVESPLVKKLTYYKWRNRRTEDALGVLGERRRAAIIHDCGTFIQIAKSNKGIERIAKSNFCRERTCNVCAWRRSAKFTAQMRPVLANLSNEYRYIFITLTMKNPIASEVKPSVDLLLSAWDKLMKRRKVKRAWLGFCRSVEVTYNAKRDDYHPHIHALIAVKPDYFVHENADYISYEELCQMWQDCLKADYKPICSLETVRPRAGSSHGATTAAALETIKYAYKVQQSIKYDAYIRLISVILSALGARRLIAFGGVFAAERSRLKQLEDDLNDEPNTTAPEEWTETTYLFNPAGWRIVED